MSREQDRIFFRNFTLILISLAVFGFFAALMGKYFAARVPNSGATEVIAKRVAPVGEVYTEEDPPPATAVAAPASVEVAAVGADKGSQVYDSVCVVCHGTGVGGAPKLGDTEAWAARIAQGADVLYQHAIDGFQGAVGLMPPKGGRTDLADEDVKAAVDYMIADSGGPATAAQPVAAVEEAGSSAEQTAEAPAVDDVALESAAPAAAAAAGEKGKNVYDTVCFACHAQGVAGAPMLGDKAAWAPRIAQGMETLYEHSIKGFMGKGLMPPKGGRSDLPDEEVKAAVDYMVSAAR